MVEYKTIRLEASDEFVERRSRFIGHAKPVKTEEDAISFLNEMRQKYWDASHNTYAYLLRDSGIQRYSDDGEPQVTAGIPILEVLTKAGLTDAAIVVTRYFGGTLLGKGGLLRAYSHGASIAVKKAQVLTMRQCLLAELCCDYSQYGKIASLIPDCGGVLDETEFTDAVRLGFHITEADMNKFQKELTEATSGQITAKIMGKKFFEFLQDS